VQRKLSFFAISLFFLLLPAYALAHDLVCREQAIAGKEANLHRAKDIIGQYTTSDKNEIKVYVERDKDGYYYHSNYCSGSCSDVYPTKIMTSKPISINEALENIIYRSSDNTWESDSDDVLMHTQVFLDKSIFDSSGKPLIDMTGAEHIDVVSGSDKVTLAGSVTRLDTDNPPPLLLKNIAGCCLDGFPPFAAARILSDLNRAAIEDNNVKIASLVRDSATAQVIGKNKMLSALSIPQSKLSNEDTLRSEIVNARGGTLIVLGHVEGNSFVTRDAGRNVLMRASFDSLHQLAAENDVNLIHLGCNTAEQISSDTLGVGVAAKFNTVEIATRLGYALKNSKTFADLLTNLSSDGLKIVVSEHFIERLKLTGYKADIYAHPKDDRSIWVKIGEFFNLPRKSA
jgi:hypothetical protein